MNKKTAIIIGVIILVLTSIVTPFLIRKLNKRAEAQTQESIEKSTIQEPIEEVGIIDEILQESGEIASGEQTEENQIESEVEEDGNSENQSENSNAITKSSKNKSSLQNTTANATSNEKQSAKEEKVSTPQVQIIEEEIVKNAVVIDVANTVEALQENTSVAEEQVISEQLAPETILNLPQANIELPEGAVGVLKIDKLGINQKVADGHSLEVLKTNLGHVDSTAYSTGNIGILGHNSGNAGYFKNLWDLKQDDVIQYTTTNGTKKYKVSEVVQIADDDWSKLANTTDNRITLITCVKNVPSMRWCIQGIEI